MLHGVVLELLPNVAPCWLLWPLAFFFCLFLPLPRFSSCLASCFFLLQLALFWLLALAPCASCLLASFAVFSSLASCFLFLLLSFCSLLLASLRNSMPVACVTRSICSRQHRDPISELTHIGNSKKRIASGSQRGVC